MTMHKNGGSFLALLLLATACDAEGDLGEDTLDPTAGMSETDSDGDPAPEDDSATDGGDPTPADDEPTPDDDEPTPEDDEPTPDDGSDDPIECDPLLQDCSDDAHCVPAGDAPDVTGFECVPLDDAPGAPGDACEADANNDIDSCEVGSFCGTDAVSGDSACVAFCDATVADACGGIEGTACVPVNDGLFGVCLPTGGGDEEFACDPLLQDCADDEHCLPTGDGSGTITGFGCVPMVDEPDAAGEACESMPDTCEQGSFCGGGACVPFCDIAAPDACAELPGSTCTEVNGGLFATCL